MLNRENQASANSELPTQPSGRNGMSIMAFGSNKLIYASKVSGAPVKNPAGEPLGRIEDIAIDSVTGDVAYAVLSLGGFLGFSEHFHPVPWSVLKYDSDTGCYVVSLSFDELRTAPTYSKSAFAKLRDSDESFPHNIFAYYGIYT